MFINCIIKINKHLQTSLNAPKRGLSKYSKVTIFKYIFKYSNNISAAPSTANSETSKFENRFSKIFPAGEPTKDAQIVAPLSIQVIFGELLNFL